ncbi:MAG TPA: hypothetical protein VIV40_18215 [Kofleriaceae bacterium]
MSRAAFAFVLAVAVIAAGCGDDGGDPDHYVAIDQVAAAYHDASCQYLVRCGQFPDQATCIAAHLTTSFVVDPNLLAAVRAGHVIYNGTYVKDCFDALAQRSCDKTSESARVVPGACRLYWSGTLTAGQSCFIDEECVSQQCSGGLGELGCQVGNCVGDTPPDTQPAALGRPCNSTYGCLSNAYCDSALLECVLLKDVGEPCTQSSECDYGLGCEGSVGARTCRALPTVGQPCPDFVCRDDGLYCSGATGTCMRVGFASTACASGAECSTYYPCDFNTGTCKQGAASGESCSSTNRCFLEGTFCDSSTFVCAPLRANGSPCTGDLECESGACDFNAGVCAPPMTCF